MKPIATGLFVGTIISLLVMHVRGAEAATETVLYSFCSKQNCADGGVPSGVIDKNNILYGTTYDGGTGIGCSRYQTGCGTVFSLDLSTGAETVLHSFVGGADGGGPIGLIDAKDVLYGTTNEGGYYNAGTAFSVRLKSGRESVLFSFGCCSDGFYPGAGPIYRKGKLYGTTEEGGIHGNGTAFSMDPKTGAITLLYSFCSQQNCTDGAFPLQLIDVAGTLYGITGGGGANDRGTVFSLDPNTGTETVLYSFCSQQNCTDGDSPQSGLIDVKGKLYGTTGYGGAYSSGTVFSLDLNSNAETVLHSFDSSGSDGWYPDGGLIDTKGTLYGTTYYGGSGQCYSGNYNEGCGTVFTLDLKTGTETILYSFQNNGTDGQNPDSALFNANGTFYGTTQLGGRSGQGTVFSITP